MASVRISLSSQDGEYEISVEGPERNGQAWFGDKPHLGHKSYLDALVDEAVKRVQRAYGSKKED